MGSTATTTATTMMTSTATTTATTNALRLGAVSALLATTVGCGLLDHEETVPAVTSAVSLRLTPEVAPVAPAEAAIAPAVAPAVAGIPLAAGFLPDPTLARGQTGGAVEGRAMAPRVPLCRGWVPETPQHTITLTTELSPLRVIVSARGDTTLMVRGPDGHYRCADDDEGLNPIVEGDFAPGTYEVFVGAYSQDTATPYVIGFTERPSVTAESLGH